MQTRLWRTSRRLNILSARSLFAAHLRCESLLSCLSSCCKRILHCLTDSTLGILAPGWPTNIDEYKLKTWHRNKANKTKPFSVCFLFAAHFWCGFPLSCLSSRRNRILHCLSDSKFGILAPGWPTNVDEYKLKTWHRNKANKAIPSSACFPFDVHFWCEFPLSFLRSRRKRILRCLGDSRMGIFAVGWHTNIDVNQVKSWHRI